MHVQDLKRWHWLSIAIVIGLALSYVWANVEWGVQLPTIGQPDFERGLVLKYPVPGHISSAIVCPPQEGKSKVVCEQLRRTKDPRVMEFRSVAFMADTPYKSDRTGETYPSVRDYLKTIKSQNTGLTAKYAWFRETWAVYVMWTSAAVILIGGVWPSVVSLMTGGGLGLQRVAKDPEYDLDRFGKGEKREESKGQAQGATQRDMDELRRLDDELEKRLASGATVGGESSGGSSDASSEPARKLDGGPLEVAQIQQDEADKEYGGEFYPVVKTIHKKDDDHPQA
jgi:hypothetical protein